MNLRSAFEGGRRVQKESVAVLFGGQSAEHEISIITGLQCIQAIDPQQYTVFPVYLSPAGKWYTGQALIDRGFYRRWDSASPLIQEIALLPDPSIGGFTATHSKEKIPVDVCLLAFHGQQGEDGSVQGLLELAGIPYTGSGVTASALAMNKFLTKSVLQSHGIPQLPGILVKKRDVQTNCSAQVERVETLLSYPLFVKPNHLGSSIGIGKARSSNELVAALAKVFLYDDAALVEPCIENLTEINIGVLDGSPPEVSVVEIPLATQGALSYEDKYLRAGGKGTDSSSGMAALNRIIDPPDLPPSIKRKIEEHALKAFDLLGCSGACRFDFMLDNRAGLIYLNEVNSIPGSLSFYLWNHSQPQKLLTDLIDRLIRLAKEKKTRMNGLKRDFGFHAL